MWLVDQKSTKRIRSLIWDPKIAFKSHEGIAKVTQFREGAGRRCGWLAGYTWAAEGGREGGRERGKRKKS